MRAILCIAKHLVIGPPLHQINGHLISRVCIDWYYFENQQQCFHWSPCLNICLNGLNTILKTFLQGTIDTPFFQTGYLALVTETFEHEFVLILEKNPANQNTLSNKYCVLIGQFSSAKIKSKVLWRKT